MAKKDDEKLIVGLDIGTSKVLAIVGEISPTGEVEIVGVGHHPSRGMKKGVVVNIESTVQSIQRAVEEAELMAGCQIHSVFAGIAGSHISSFNSHGIVAIKDKEVGPNDVDRVIEAARALAIPADQKVLHILPQEFIIDKQEGIREPIGMSGVRLEAKVHIVTGAGERGPEHHQMRAPLRTRGRRHHPRTAGLVDVGAERRREGAGVCIVDIGGGTTDISVFTDGAIRHTAVIPIAGDQVTNDIAVALRTPTQNAEDIKKKYGCALTQLAHRDDTIEVPSVGDRPPRKLSRQTLAEVIEPRIEELYGLIQAELRRSGFEDVLGSGLVLTGGCAKMEGMVDLAEEVFHMPVRLGVPQYVGGLKGVVQNPIFATGVGLVLYGARARGQTVRRAAADEPRGQGTGRAHETLVSGEFLSGNGRQRVTAVKP